MQIWEGIKIPSRISIAIRPGTSLSTNLLLHLRPPPRLGRRGGAPATSIHQRPPSPASTISSHRRHQHQALHCATHQTGVWLPARLSPPCCFFSHAPPAALLLPSRRLFSSPRPKLLLLLLSTSLLLHFSSLNLLAAAPIPCCSFSLHLPADLHAPTAPLLLLLSLLSALLLLSQPSTPLLL